MPQERGEANMATRILNVKLVPDGSGRAMIHWLQEDAAGPIKTTGHDVYKCMPAFRGRIACNPAQNTVNPQQRNGETLLCLHSNDARAVTCPKCMATPEYLDFEALLLRLEKEAEDKRQQVAVDAEKAHADAVAVA
jgi:hypothetical protein